MIGDLLEREQQFNSAREMNRGAGQGKRKLLRLAVWQVGVTGGES